MIAANFKSLSKELLNDRHVIVSVVFLSMALLTIGQDYAESQFNNYSFYISESVLFKSFWILFIPISALIFKIGRNLLGNKKISNFILLVFSASIFHALLFAGAINLISGLLFEYRFEFQHTLIRTFAEDFYKFILVYTLITFISFRREIALEPKDSSASQHYLDILNIRSGRKIISLPVNEIQHIITDDPYLSIHTTDAKHLHSSTIKEISCRLNPATFVRVHRSAIINVQKIAQMTSRLTGDYDIEMANGSIVRMSRNYSANLKKAITPSQLSLK